MGFANVKGNAPGSDSGVTDPQATKGLMDRVEYIYQENGRPTAVADAVLGRPLVRDGKQGGITAARIYSKEELAHIKKKNPVAFGKLPE